jgi:trans-2-enoyl-CoA reductase
VFLKRFYDAALDIYLAGDGGARGCYSIGTAATEANVDPNVRAFLADSTRNTDAFFQSRIDKARERGEIAQDADTTALAYLATATMHTIAIRSRAGLAREELDAIVDAAIDVICR